MTSKWGVAFVSRTYASAKPTLTSLALRVCLLCTCSTLYRWGNAAVWSRPLTVDLMWQLRSNCHAPSLRRWLVARHGSVRRLRLQGPGAEGHSTAMFLLAALADGPLAALELYWPYSAAAKPLAAGWALAFPQLKSLWLPAPQLDASSCLPQLTSLTALCLDCCGLPPSAQMWGCGLPGSLRALELRGMAMSRLPRAVLAATQLERLHIQAHQSRDLQFDGLERLAPCLTTLVLSDCGLDALPQQVRG